MWRDIACFLPPERRNDPTAVAEAAQTWLRDFAFALYMHLAAVRGWRDAGSQGLPKEWDPLV